MFLVMGHLSQFFLTNLRLFLYNWLGMRGKPSALELPQAGAFLHSGEGGRFPQSPQKGGNEMNSQMKWAIAVAVAFFGLVSSVKTLNGLLKRPPR